jgi:hypothetical protein
VGELLSHALRSPEEIIGKMSMTELSELIIFSPNNLNKFFERSFIIIESGVPKFGVPLEEPLYYLGEDENLNEEQLKQMVKVSNEDDELPIIFKRVLFLQNYETGSKESMNFHQALSESSIDTIFGTETV